MPDERRTLRALITEAEGDEVIVVFDQNGNILGDCYAKDFFDDDEYWTNFDYEMRDFKVLTDYYLEAEKVWIIHVEEEEKEFKKDDIEFLCSLKKELETQSNDGTANPLVWGIMESDRIYGFDSEYASDWEVCDGENASTVGEPNNIDAVLKELRKDYELTLEEADESDIEDIVYEANKELARRSGHKPSSGYAPLTLVFYQETEHLAKGPVFLTKKAAKEYIERYGYNHKNPHTYAMCAYRCPEYDRVLKILKETDWKEASL